MLLEKYVSRLCHCECHWQTNNAWGRQEWGKRTCCNEWSETFFTYQRNCRRARENTTRNNVSCIHIAAITLTLKSIPNERKQITTDFYLDSMTAQHRLCHNKKQHRRENARMCWTQRVRKRTKNQTEIIYPINVQYRVHSKFVFFEKQFPYSITSWEKR